MYTGSFLASGPIHCFGMGYCDWKELVKQERVAQLAESENRDLSGAK